MTVSACRGALPGNNLNVCRYCKQAQLLLMEQWTCFKDNYDLSSLPHCTKRRPNPKHVCSASECFRRCGHNLIPPTIFFLKHMGHSLSSGIQTLHGENKKKSQVKPSTNGYLYPERKAIFYTRHVCLRRVRLKEKAVQNFVVQFILHA